MATGDLVTLAAVKSWLSISDTTADTLLKTWITGASRAVINMLGRGSTLGYQQTVETRDGLGGSSILLKRWPVIRVTALSINGISYSQQADAPFGSGFFWDKWDGDDTQGHQRLWCVGSAFYRNAQNIVIAYDAGYQVQSENWAIPASLQVIPLRPWFSDQGVINVSTGLPLIYAAPGSALVTGQYSIDPATGIYLFASVDVGNLISLTYSYTPEDLQQGVVDVVAWHFKNRDRIGMVSRSQGGAETTAFSQQSLGALSKMMIQPFKNVIPL